MNLITRFKTFLQRYYKSVLIDPVELEVVREVMSRRKPKKYLVFGGDTLHSIAARYLGSGDRWMEIYELNKIEIGLDPNRLTPGQELKMPNDYKN